MGKKVSVEVLKGFSTSDASGVVSGNKGEILVIDEFLAIQLKKQGFVRKQRIKKEKIDG